EESRRKQIEANGIAAFQRTVSQGISESYLRWQGIAATVALAQSSNTKIVVIGTGKDGLPIILGNVDTPYPPVPPPNLGTGNSASPSGAPPAPSGKMPPNNSTAPDGTPAEPPKLPGATAPDKKSTTDSSSQFDFSDIKSLISRLSEALGSAGLAPL